jgi:hypothetical protein
MRKREMQNFQYLETTMIHTKSEEKMAQDETPRKKIIHYSFLFREWLHCAKIAVQIKW